jgi:putative membrane protein
VSGDSREGAPDASTRLAEERTRLANERTFAAWLRTGLAAVAVGLGFHALFEKVQPDWVPKGIATAFLLIAIFILYSAERGARRVRNKLHADIGDDLAPVDLRVIAYAAIAATMALIAAMWLLKVKGA